MHGSSKHVFGGLSALPTHRRHGTPTVSIPLGHGQPPQVACATRASSRPDPDPAAFAATPAPTDRPIVNVSAGIHAGEGEPNPTYRRWMVERRRGREGKAGERDLGRNERAREEDRSE